MTTDRTAWTPEDHAYEAAYECCWLGWPSSVRVAAWLARHEAALTATLGDEGARRHPALRAVTAHLAGLHKAYTAVPVLTGATCALVAEWLAEEERHWMAELGDSDLVRRFWRLRLIVTHLAALHEVTGAGAPDHVLDEVEQRAAELGVPRIGDATPLRPDKEGALWRPTTRSSASCASAGPGRRTASAFASGSPGRKRRAATREQ